MRAASIWLGVVLAHLVSITAFAGEIRFASGPTSVSIIYEPFKQMYEKESGDKLILVGDPKTGGLRSVYEELMSGEADLTAVPTTWEDATRAFTEQKIATPEDLKKLSHRLVGKDLLKIVAHPDVGVKQLSSAQVADLFTGKAKDWSQVGGAKVPVTVILLANVVATNTFFMKRELHDAPYASNAIKAPDRDAFLSSLSKTPGAIGFLSSRNVTPGLLEIPMDRTIGRPIVIFTKGKPRPEVERFIHFLERKLKTS